MSRFSADWLGLREPLDAASRSATLSATLVQALRRDNPRPAAIHVVDLGAGTAANLRYLAPLIEGWQDWLLVENDALLLEMANERVTSWATSSGASAIECGLETIVYGTGFNCRLRSLCADITQVDQLVLSHGTLVSASALLDLVSNDWLARLADRCASVLAPVCFALTYDGRIECDPVDLEDANVRELVNRHQQTDKGFGPALGPDAARQAMRIFEDRGYETVCGPSDWNIDRTEHTLQRALIDDWSSAARQVAPERERELRKWRERRCALVDDGQSELIVGHVDMIGWPKPV